LLASFFYNGAIPGVQLVLACRSYRRDISRSGLTTQVIDSLPKGTTFASLLKTAPNVRAEPLAAGFQIDGASGAENVFVVGGQEVTNFRTGQLNT
jgi:hypothetical protein